jgi:hypothetical protein
MGKTPKSLLNSNPFTIIHMYPKLTTSNKLENKSMACPGRTLTRLSSRALFMV